MKKYALLFILLRSVAFANQGVSYGLPLPGLPVSLGQKITASSTSVTIASDQPPIPFIAGGDIKENRFHYAASQNINGSAGAWVALGSGAAIASTIKQIQYSSTLGLPVEIGVGANAGASVQKFVINQGGGPVVITDAQNVGDKLWIRSLSTSAITSGYLTVSLVGP